MADKEAILQLKREALVLKRQGNVAGAKAKLAEATLLQYSHLDYTSVDDCAVLKKIAWALVSNLHSKRYITEPSLRAETAEQNRRAQRLLSETRRIGR